MNILAIGAHPDDCEAMCGGTLAKYASQGHKVFMASATNGNVGSATLSAEEIAKIRMEEGKKGASLIGAEFLCLDFDDEMFFNSREARLKFIDLVRYCQADVILTHSPVDYNPDHELTGRMVRDIAVMIPIAKLETPNKPVDKIPVIVHCEPAHGMGFVPEQFVDISDFIDKKIEMLSQHASQHLWAQANYGGAYDENRTFFAKHRQINAYRGWQCGVKYAEGFVMSKDAYRVVPRRVLP